ncbi:DUF4124 domain-containing protein, partial [Xanthomonas oryzae pv. oryzae]
MRRWRLLGMMALSVTAMGSLADA